MHPHFIVWREKTAVYRGRRSIKRGSRSRAGPFGRRVKKDQTPCAPRRERAGEADSIFILTTKGSRPKGRPLHKNKKNGALKGAAIGAGEECVLNPKKDIQPMTTFRHNSVKLLSRLKKTKKALILTVNGRAEVVVQSMEAYQRLLDIAAQADEKEGIRQGLEDVKNGRERPVREALAEFRRILRSR